MHLHVNGAWTPDFLDPTPVGDQVRITVRRQIAVAPVDDQFFVRDRDPWMLWQYLRRLGVRRVWRKVRSRESERHRNDAWLSVGIGTTAEGEHVAFVDPAGAAAAERVVLDRSLVAPVPDGTEVAPGHIVVGPAAPLDGLADRVRDELSAVAGWRPDSGTAVHLGDHTFAAVVALACGPPPPDATVLEPPPRPSPVREVHDLRPGAAAGALDLTCFGLGQYAKTQVIPNLGERLTLTGVHEIDPRQFGPIAPDDPVRRDTSPHPRPDESIRNAVVAGYHHTHAPLAVDLLERGARHVIVEKPIATSVDQLDALLAALDRHPDARVHVSFQRRHSRVNERLRADLGAGPLSMAATVYEVPLPERHWYRWPSVGNEVVSNGCHWIDHFLFLNDWSEPTALHAQRLHTQLLLGIDLRNGASASLSLRHQGAPRLGVRDHVTFWNGDRSAMLIDQARYRAESGFRAGPERRSHPYAPLEDMYRTFARRIAEDLPGDDRRSIDVSARTTLALADLADRTGPGG